MYNLPLSKFSPRKRRNVKIYYFPKTPVDIVIEKNRIVQIEGVGNPGVPIDGKGRPKLKEGGKEINCEGKYILPGEVTGFETAVATPNDDLEWHTIVPLVLGPHPKLSESHRRAIELDYGMKDGEVEFCCRQAFLFYALRHLRLDANAAERPEAQQIVLKNKLEVEKYRHLATSGADA